MVPTSYLFFLPCTKSQSSNLNFEVRSVNIDTLELVTRGIDVLPLQIVYPPAVYSISDVSCYIICEVFTTGIDINNDRTNPSVRTTTFVTGENRDWEKNL